MNSILDAIARQPKVVFETIHPNAILPKKALERDAGWDISSIENVIIPAKSSLSVKCGLKLAFIDEGYWIKIESRSGLAFKNDIVAFQGIVDGNYRGEIGVKLFNFSNKDYEIKVGDRIAQMIIYYENIDFSIEWGKVVPSNRGHSGFGSTGK